MIGFTFRNIHSSTLGVNAKNVDRSVLPEVHSNEHTIPGRDGTVKFGKTTYGKRPISMEIGVFDNLTAEDFRLNIREIARWLSGTGQLIFDDEPDKAYEASVYRYTGISSVDQDDYINDPFSAGTIPVVFDCQPFAESLEYRQVNVPSITSKPYNVPLVVSGTSETGCIITIKNTGTTNINDISLRRKARV